MQFLTIFHVFFRGKYVEAEYECQHNYKLEPEKTVRLVCVEHKWLGKPPECVPLSNSSISTPSKCMCDQLCTVVGIQLVCSCFRGFRQQGTACHGMYVDVSRAHTWWCHIELLKCVLYKRGYNWNVKKIEVNKLRDAQIYRLVYLVSYLTVHFSSHQRQSYHPSNIWWRQNYEYSYYVLLTWQML